MSIRSKKILVIAEQYFPLNVPGAYRISSFAKYLIAAGYEVKILAPLWTEENSDVACFGKNQAYTQDSALLSPAEVIRFKVCNRLERAWERYYNRIALRRYDRRQDANAAVKKGLQTYTRYRFDLIIASAPPDYVWYVGSTLSEKLSIPWIADARDVQGQFQNEYKESALKNSLKKLLNIANIESNILRTSTRILTVSQGLAELLNKKGLKNVLLIENGYEEADFKVEPETSNKFRLLYAGTVHPAQRIDIVLDALDELVAELPQFQESAEFVLYGNRLVDTVLFTNRPCSSVVRLCGVIEKRQLIPIMLGSQLLLHLSFQSSKGITTSKLSEYLATRVPILSVPGDRDVVTQTLLESRAGEIASDVREAKEKIRAAFVAWKQGNNSKTNLADSYLESYTRRHQVQKLVSVIDGLFKNELSLTS